MPRVKADITPEVIKWARLKSGYNIEDAAWRIGRPVEEIQAWEKGELKPTLAQARKASDVYKRPLAVFFLPRPPKDFDTLKDFRVLPEGLSDEYGPKLSYIIRRLQNRQRWLSDYLRSDGYKSLDFIGSAQRGENYLELANEIRKIIGININEIINCRGREDALKLWIDHVERIRIYVCQAGNLKHEKVSVEEARGVALTDRFAPFIFINAQDAKAAQIFTLAHELVHLWINEPGLSNLRLAGRPTSDTQKIETFCNKVAAEILVPQSLFGTFQKTLKDQTIEEQITSLSIYFKVSQEVIARRYLNLSWIKPEYYRDLVVKLKEESTRKKEKEKLEQKNKKVILNYYLLKIINNGRAFTRTVINAYQSGEITGVTTYKLLEMKINYIPAVADMVKYPLRGRKTAL